MTTKIIRTRRYGSLRRPTLSLATNKCLAIAKKKNAFNNTIFFLMIFLFYYVFFYWKLFGWWLCFIFPEQKFNHILLVFLLEELCLPSDLSESMGGGLSVTDKEKTNRHRTNLCRLVLCQINYTVITMYKPTTCK